MAGFLKKVFITALKLYTHFLDPNHIGEVLIIKVSPEKAYLNLTKTIWMETEQEKKNLDASETIWTVQNQFGPIEGQSLYLKFLFRTK